MNCDYCGGDHVLDQCESAESDASYPLGPGPAMNATMGGLNMEIAPQLPAVRLPATLPAAVSRSIAETLAGKVQALQARAHALATMSSGLRMRQASLALDTACKAFQISGKAEHDKAKAPAWKECCEVDQYFRNLMNPIAVIRKQCATRITDYDREQARLTAEENRQRAAIDLAKAQADKQAQVDHLVAQAAAANDETLLVAAVEMAAAPLELPVMVSAEIYRPPGSSVSSEIRAGEVIDLRALVTWINETPERFTVLFARLFGPIRQAQLDYEVRQGTPFPIEAVAIRSKGKFTNRVPIS